MTELSPQAQAVLDAFRSSHLSINNLAAALQAAADQVVHNRVCRMELHLIADELEGANG